MTEGPDFLCIGMQKAATGWLYDHLALHPEFWMPPLKEIRYLGRDVPMVDNARAFLRKYNRGGKQFEAEMARRRPLNDDDMIFFQDILALRGKPRDIDKYAALFRFKNGLLSGDVTPAYSDLNEEIIAEVAAKFPHLKVVQMVRNPVDRLWSQLSMAARNERFDPNLPNDATAFRAYLEIAGAPGEKDKSVVDIAKVGFPTRAALRWDKAAPQLRFQHFFFDDIAGRPEELRREALLFLGADPEKAAGPAASENRKALRVKLELTPEAERVMAEFFRSELRACAKRYGGHAEGWAARYGA